jgi:hypothetical protein
MAAAFAAGTATASDIPPSVDDLAASGLRMRDEGRDEEALALFRRSFETSHQPRSLAQMGLAEQALGRFVPAERDIRSTLSSQNDPWIGLNRAVLEHALSVVSSHLAEVEVISNIPGSALWINGSSVGTLPSSPVRVEAGGIVFEVRARGYETIRRAVEVAAGARFREEVALVPVVRSLDLREPTPVQSADTAPHASPRRTAAWSLVVAGSTLLAGGIAAQLVRATDVTTYNDDALCFFGALTRDERCGRYRIAADRAQTLALVGYLGAVGALGAAALFILVDRPDRPTRSQVSCELGPLAVACSRSF